MKKNESRIEATFIILSVLLLACSQKNTPEEKQTELYPNYFQKQAIIPFDSVTRHLKLKELISNPIYDSIVLGTVVSSKYLPSLNGIGECIQHMDTLTKTFAILDDTYQKLTKEELNFVLASVGLIYHGGLSKELVEAFERYRLHFGYYGKAGNTIINENGQEIDRIQANYNLTPIFAVLEPNNKQLANSIFEVYENGIDSWKENTSPSLRYRYLSDKVAYDEYLNAADPGSPYVLRYDYELTAQQIFDDYNANEVAADQKYKGKKVLLTGIVQSINKDVMDDCYIVLETDTYLANVHCSIKNANSAASVMKGQSYSFVGECSGLLMGTVMISNCVIR